MHTGTVMIIFQELETQRPLFSVGLPSRRQKDHLSERGVADLDPLEFTPGGLARQEYARCT
jgi:hypothetical protein